MDKVNYSGTPLLTEINEELVWYSRNIVKNFYKDAGLSGFSEPRVLDFGAGTGSLAIIWRDNFGLTPECAELDPNLKAHLVSLGFIVHDSINKIADRYHYIYTSNVLEHIEDDFLALVSLRNLLLPNGRLGIYVPAFPILFSNLDRNVGHYRRYRKSQLKKLVNSAGLDLVHCEYKDSIGFVATLVLKLFDYSFSTSPSSKKLMFFYDKFLFPLTRILDFLGLKYLFGKNLYMTVIPRHGSF